MPSFGTPNLGINPLQCVFTTMPLKWYANGSKIADHTFQISYITDIDTSSIQSIKLNASKQCSKISDNLFTELYNFTILTTSGKQISVPFSVDLSYTLDSFNISVSPILLTSQCTAFNQNELNSSYDGTWRINQEVFDMSAFLSDQQYDISTNVLSIDMSAISIANGKDSISINSESGTILKINDHFINEVLVLDRNSYEISDPQT